jgi:hypothetical protein
MSQTAVQNLGAMDVASGFAPKNGPRSVPTLIDFSIASPFNLDLTFLEQMDKLEFVQTVYIDNSLNASSVTVQSLGTQQKVTCPPNAQGYFPLLVTQQPKFIISTASGTPIVPIQFLNVAIPCMIWSSIIQAVSVGQTGVDGSSTITLGGTAQPLFGGVVPVNGFTVVNPDAANVLWLNVGGTALANGSGSIPVPALGSYTTPDLYRPEGAVSIVGANTAQKFTAKRY